MSIIKPVLCRPSRVFLVLLALLAAAHPSARAATSQQVEKSLTQGKAWLYAHQANGTWEPATPENKDQPFSVTGVQSGGLTAMATCTLLAAGENANDPRLAQAIAFLRKAEMRGTYALGMRSQVWLMLPPSAENRDAAKRDAAALVAMMKTKGAARGFYDYASSGPEGAYSHSRSQYAVLGLWAAEQVGVEVPGGYWKLVEEAWQGHQEPDGGWGYTLHDPSGSSPGLTAAGVATLFITQEYTRADQGIDCRGNVNNPAIDRGLKWLSDHFDQVTRPPSIFAGYRFPTIYAIERVGVASGFKYFNGIDWYAKGADWVLASQRPDGGWARSSGEIGDVATTCFSMLFLARGQAPVAVNKLAYAPAAGKPACWNQRPRDIANVTRWIGQNLERNLNWQIVDFSGPPADLLDAPILYISGSQVLGFSDEHKARLRQFVEAGGLILGHADGGSMAFATSFRKLGAELFSAYDFRELPADHVIYTAQQFPRAKWKLKPSVLGLSNGARELMLLLPTGDPGRYWQVRSIKAREELHEIMADIFLYAVEQKNLRVKGETYIVQPDPKVTTGRTIKLARLKYPGNWDPEPGGWRRLAAVLHNQDKTDLAVETVAVGQGKLGPGYPFAHLTGTAGVNLNATAVAELKSYLAGGGTLIIDAAGGSSEFATAMETVLADVLPDVRQPLPVLPPDHPLYADGAPIEQISYRRYARRTVPGIRGPRLRSYEKNGRLLVVWSPEDLSVGLVGQSVDGIRGYSPETCTALVRRILLGDTPGPASRGASAPASAPAPGQR